MVKKKKIIAFIVMGLLLLIVVSGISYYLYSQYNGEGIIYGERNGMKIIATLYDSNGNILSPNTLQTAVNGRVGIFYMSIIVKTSNVGNVQLTNIRINESHPIEFNYALQEASAIQPNLAVGESNVIQWDTANTCVSSANCGSSESCVATSQGNKCLIDITGFNGTKQFGLTIFANYTNAQSQKLITSTLVNLAYLFEPDVVMFRTTSLSSSGYGNSGTQVVVDRASDGALESYTYDTSGTDGYTPTDFVSFTPQGNMVYRCGTSSNICVSQSIILNKSDTYSSVLRWRYILGGTLTTSTVPTEPYRTQNCAGVSPCQEMYTISLTPPAQQCGNNDIEGTELCDGTDLGTPPANCTSIGMGFTGGTLGCSSCTSWDTSLCTGGGGGGGNIKFRTFDLSYASGNAVAYKNTCDGSNLIRYGKTSGTCSSEGKYCDGTDYTLLVPSFSGTTKMWAIGSDLCICDDGVINHVLSRRYTTADSDATKVNPSGISIDDNYEVSC